MSVSALDGDVWSVAGVVLFAAGFVGSVAAQQAMGAWWRVGVDDGEHVELVELVARGPFGLVRNPFFSALTLTAIGLLLLVPNVVALVALLALLVAIELQVRVVEEPSSGPSTATATAATPRRSGVSFPVSAATA